MVFAEQDAAWALLGWIFVIGVPALMILSVLSAVADGKRDPNCGDKSNLF